MDHAPPGIAFTQRMYELREQGYTVPEATLRLRAEGYTLATNPRPQSERVVGEETTGVPRQ